MVIHHDFWWISWKDLDFPPQDVIWVMIVIKISTQNYQLTVVIGTYLFCFLIYFFMNIIHVVISVISIQLSLVYLIGYICKKLLFFVKNYYCFFYCIKLYMSVLSCFMFLKFFLKYKCKINVKCKYFKEFEIHFFQKYILKLQNFKHLEFWFGAFQNL